MNNYNTNINLLNSEQKVNYIKNLLFNNDLNSALNILLKDEKKDLNIIKIIIKVSEENLIKDKINTQNSNSIDIKIFLYSKILSILSFHNKNDIVKIFLKSLDQEKLKNLSIYEYKNKTEISINNKTFNKICNKYKNSSMLDDTEVLKLDDDNKKENSNRKTLKLCITIMLIIMLLISSYTYYDCKKLVDKYTNLIYPGIYLNEINLAGTKKEELNNIIKQEKEKILKGTVTVTNPNSDYKITYQEINITVDDDSILDKITSYNDNLSFIEKVKRVKNNYKNKTFYLKGEFKEEDINNFINLLEEKLNTTVKDDGIVVDENHNVMYDEGTNGFVLDKDKTIINVKEAFLNLKEETIIEAEGEIIKKEMKHEYLKDINYKVSSYTTYFLNQGNRGHNIVLASSRLNDTVVMPEETFSYLKVVGPYGSSNGYLPAPIYLNGTTSTANGGGVCQLASTTYMAQLKAGLETVSRRNHTFAPTYVPKGLDSTVYSTTTDYKFKNQYKYPIYIVSYVKGNYLTVDIWSNENALEGKTYEPYSVYSNGGYLAYLKVIKDGKVLETKYLDKSVYKSH